MPDLALRAHGLGKRYRIGLPSGGYRTLRDGLTRAARAIVRADGAQAPAGTIWALRDVSFDVTRGQVLGVIGRNGAGKSTLLKILSRVTEPTEGWADVAGRVGSLLEVGTGFHPELTGRENVYLNGAILGMKRTEIDRKFDEIVQFSEVETFLDTPVKHYSSGMYLRLAFAVAAHLEPDILVVDEVLAVGDAEFQRKCLGKMSDVAREGRTVLFVSHNMSAILRLTDETLVLEAGRVALRAPSSEAVDYYLGTGAFEQGARTWEPAAVAPGSPFEPVALRLLDGDGRAAGQVLATTGCVVEFEYRLRTAVTGLRTGIYLSTARGEPVFTSFDTDSQDMFNRWTSRAAGSYLSRCRIPGNLLNDGRYVVGVNASSFKIRSYFTEEYALTFSVDGAGAPGSHWAEVRSGPVRPALAWDVVELAR